MPWLKQWHNAVSVRYSERMGDYFAGFIEDQARELGFTREDLLN